MGSVIVFDVHTGAIEMRSESGHRGFLFGRMAVIIGQDVDTCRKLTEGMTDDEIEKATESLKHGGYVVRDGKICPAGQPQDLGGEG